MWASLRKAALIIGRRAIPFLLLGFLLYSHEEAENCETCNRYWIDKTARWITIVYILIMTIIFIIHFLRTSVSQLHPVAPQCHDTENPCPCLVLYDYTKEGRKCKRYFCCGFLTCYSICFETLYSLYVCKYIRRSTSQYTCYRRPCILVCGVFWSIFLREGVAALGALLIVIFEDDITSGLQEQGMSPGARSALLTLLSMLAYVFGLLIGFYIGRLLVAFCECRRYAPEPIEMQERKQNPV